MFHILLCLLGIALLCFNLFILVAFFQSSERPDINPQCQCQPTASAGYRLREWINQTSWKIKRQVWHMWDSVTTFFSSSHSLSPSITSPSMECSECNCPTVECPECNCPTVECPKLSCPIVECPKCDCPAIECPEIECPVVSCPIVECENTTILYAQLDHLQRQVTSQTNGMESLEQEVKSLTQQLEQEKLHSQSILRQQSILETQLQQAQQQISLREALEKEVKEYQRSLSEQELEVSHLKHSLEMAENEMKSQMILIQQKDEEIVAKKKEMEERIENMKKERESVLLIKEKEIQRIQEEVFVERKKVISTEESLHTCENEIKQKEEEVSHLQESMRKDRELCDAGTECSLVYSYFKRFLWSENSKFGNIESTTPNENYLELQQDQRLIRCLMYNGDEELLEDKSKSLWDSPLIFYSIVILCAILISISFFHHSFLVMGLSLCRKIVESIKRYIYIRMFPQ